MFASQSANPKRVSKLFCFSRISRIRDSLLMVCVATRPLLSAFLLQMDLTARGNVGDCKHQICLISIVVILMNFYLGNSYFLRHFRAFSELWTICICKFLLSFTVDDYPKLTSYFTFSMILILQPFLSVFIIINKCFYENPEFLVFYSKLYYSCVIVLFF